MPQWARSKRPGRDWWAPVNAPFSTPKSSASMSCSGSAAQFMVMNGAVARGLALCRARANISLPTPVSPSSSTLTWLEAVRCISSRACRKLADWPTRLSLRASSSIEERRFCTSSCRRRMWSATESGSKYFSSSAASGHSAAGRPTMWQSRAPAAWHCVSLNRMKRPMSVEE